MPSIDWSSDVCSADLPWAELLRQWSSFHPVFSYLPRKFKIAVIASKEDRAAMRLHDIGIELLDRDGVKIGRASCRERLCLSVSFSVVAVALTQTNMLRIITT